LGKGLGWEHVLVDKLGAIVCLLSMRELEEQDVSK
jgi:hypothetical protein